MLMLRDGTYISYINDQVIRLRYKGNNKCNLYINGEFKGICRFHHIKQKITKIEKNHMLLYNLKKDYRKLFEELGVSSDE